MLRDLVSKARSGTSAEIEAIISERDFFRERYAEQIEAIEHLKIKLKESQRVVDKLRSQILVLELEKKSRSGVDMTTNQIMEGSFSGNTDPMSKSGVDGVEADCSRVEDEPSNEVVTSLDVGLGASTLRSAPQAANENSIDQAANNGAADERSAPIDDEPCNEGRVEEEEDEDESSSDNDENEAEQIRANAERMLQWANYQSSKRSTPNTSMNFDPIDDGYNDNESSNCEATSSTLRSSTPSESVLEDKNLVYSIPKSLNQKKNFDDSDDGDSSLGSSSTHSSAQLVGTGANSRGGKIGKLFNNLRGMLEGPPSDDTEADSDDDLPDG